MDYIIIILVMAILMVMVAGVVLMGVGGDINTRYSNKLMKARICLQGMVLLVLVVTYLFDV